MSFIGYTEHICAVGHYWCEDAYFSYDNELSKCFQCGAKGVWQRLVDETNGMDPEIPETMPYPLELLRYDDEWHVDHYGNRYATQVPIYKIPEKK